MKKSPLVNVTVLLLSAWSISSPGGSIYKWTDANGVVHYEDKAPTDHAQSSTKITLHNNQPSSSQNKSPSLGYEALKQKLGKLEAAQKQNTEEEVINQKNKEAQDARTKGCENAKKTLNAFQETARIRVKEKNGEHRALTEEEKTAEENKLKDQIKELCSPAS